VIVNNLIAGRRKSVHGMGLGNQLVSDRLANFNELYPNQYLAEFSYGPNDQKQYQASIKITKIPAPPKRRIFKRGKNHMDL
jgi:hypothetical protein